MARTRKDLRRLKQLRDLDFQANTRVESVDSRRQLQARVAKNALSISDPSGGSTVDTEARAAIVSILDALRDMGWIES